MPWRSASTFKASGKVNPSISMHEFQNVAAHAAAEAFVELARLVDVERSRLFLMERAQPDVAAGGAHALQAHVLANHLDDVDGRLELLDKIHLLRSYLL